MLCRRKWILGLIFSSVSIVTTVVCVAGDDSFDASNVGEAAEVVQEVVCDDELILIKG
jgi:T-complex protein 1 subunit alpha